MNTRKMISFVLLAILVGAIAMYLICENCFQNGIVTSTRMDLWQHMTTGHDLLTEHYGDIMTAQDYAAFTEGFRQMHTGNYTIQVDENRNILVIEYGDRNSIFEQYQVLSIKVFAPDEYEDFIKYLSGTK